MTITLKASGMIDEATSPAAANEDLAAISFTSGALIVVVLGCTKGGTSTGVFGVSATSHTFTQQAVGVNASSNFAANSIYTAPTSGGSVTININSNFQGVYCMSYFIFEVTGQHASPIGANAGNASNTPTDGSRTLTLSAAPASSSVVIAGIHCDTPTGTSTITAGTGWTPDATVDSGATFFGVAQSQHRSGSTSTTVQWDDILPAGSPGVDSHGAVALEIVMAPDNVTIRYNYDVRLD